MLQCINKTVQNELKEQRCSTLDMLLDTFGATLSGNMLSRLSEKSVVKTGEGGIRTGQIF